MNWDLVIEEGMESQQSIDHFDYGCEASGVEQGRPGKLKPFSSDGQPVRLLKLHGSINWLYCDVCRRLFWLPASNVYYLVRSLFRERDWRVVMNKIGRSSKPKQPEFACPCCCSNALSTRFATFSYRKALDFPMFSRSWLQAEEMLRNAKTWTFIGYSMPGADYEFKYLLKHVQLSQSSKAKITLITGGDADRADETEANFKKFLGPDVVAFKKGLDNATLAHLTRPGALNSRKSKAR